jgi:Gas vesicle synthesis protein GvpL/GvpF
VRGAVELGVTACWSDRPAVPPARSGTEYMLGRLDVHRRAQRAAEIVAPLGALARDSKVKVLPRPSIPLLAAYLVDRDRTEEFVARAAELDADFEDGQLLCTGPWPPYSFVQDSTLDRELQGER